MTGIPAGRSALATAARIAVAVACGTMVAATTVSHAQQPDDIAADWRRSALAPYGADEKICKWAKSSLKVAVILPRQFHQRARETVLNAASTIDVLEKATGIRLRFDVVDAENPVVDGYDIVLESAYETNAFFIASWDASEAAGLVEGDRDQTLPPPGAVVFLTSTGGIGRVLVRYGPPNVEDAMAFYFDAPLFMTNLLGIIRITSAPKFDLSKEDQLHVLVDMSRRLYGASTRCVTVRELLAH